MIYKVWVSLEEEYDDIEADSEEEAFLIASEAAMSGGSWQCQVQRMKEDGTPEDEDHVIWVEKVEE